MGTRTSNGSPSVSAICVSSSRIASLGFNPSVIRMPSAFAFKSGSSRAQTARFGRGYCLSSWPNRSTKVPRSQPVAARRRAKVTPTLSRSIVARPSLSKPSPARKVGKMKTKRSGSLRRAVVGFVRPIGTARLFLIRFPSRNLTALFRSQRGWWLCLIDARSSETPRSWVCLARPSMSSFGHWVRSARRAMAASRRQGRPSAIETKPSRTNVAGGSV